MGLVGRRLGECACVRQLDVVSTSTEGDIKRRADLIDEGLKR